MIVDRYPRARRGLIPGGGHGGRADVISLRGGGGRRTPRGCVSFTSPGSLSAGGPLCPQPLSLPLTPNIPHVYCRLRCTIKASGLLFRGAGTLRLEALIAMRRAGAALVPPGPCLAPPTSAARPSKPSRVFRPLASQKRLSKMIQITCGAR
jgi:hypothetical protein